MPNAQQQQQQQPAAYVRHLDVDTWEYSYDSKFFTGKFTQIHKIVGTPVNLEALLREFINKCFQQAIDADTELLGFVPDRLGARISSCDYEVAIPIAKIEATATELLLQRFLRVVQSRLGQPFTICIDTICVNAIQQRSK